MRSAARTTPHTAPGIMVVHKREDGEKRLVSGKVTQLMGSVEGDGTKAGRGGGYPY
jgi:hypothetical protein